MVVAATSSCDPQNPVDACHDITTAYCQRIFDLSTQGCASATDFLANGSLNDCVTKVAATTAINGQTCTSITKDACKPNDFSVKRAHDCTDLVGTLVCSYDWFQGPLDVVLKCQHICCLHAGNVGSGLDCCSGSSHVVDLGGCSSEVPESVCD